MKPCVKCGTLIARPNSKHDCKGIRQRKTLGVTSEVERMKAKNLQQIREIGQRGGAPPRDGEGDPLPPMPL
jgi:hypothetical protein